MNTEEAQEVHQGAESESEGEFEANDGSSSEEIEDDGIESSEHSSIDLEAYKKVRDNIPDHPDDEDEEEKMESVGSGREMKSVGSGRFAESPTQMQEDKFMERVMDEVHRLLPKMVREAVEDALADRRLSPSKNSQLIEKVALKRTATK